VKILSAEQIRKADAYTIKHEPIKSIDLMERAASKCFDWLYGQAPNLFPSHITEEKDWTFYVVSGTGNNGGDGLVIARLLNRIGYNVKVVLVRLSEKGSSDFEKNLSKLGKLGKELVEIRSEDDLMDITDSSVIIDAIFGTGLNRPPEGIAASVIEKINESGARVISIDMPSGLFSENNADGDPNHIVEADYVLSFQVPKLSFYLAENADFIGEVIILDIGLHPEILKKTEAAYHLLTDDFVRPMLRQRRPFDHKGSFGHALLIAGSDGKRGAAVLATSGAIRAGAGLVTLHTDNKGAETIHAHLPEAMVSFDSGKDARFSEVPELGSYNAIGIGPGLGTSDESSRAMKLLIQDCKVPLVIDADALNILAENPTWLAFLPKGTILTPHPGEFARLIGEKKSHYDNLEAQRELSKKHGIYILLKGGRSSLSLPDGTILINGTGNPGMATGGMGDVLTGIITGLLASGYTPSRAAALGMYLHGRAGDISLESQSQESLLASDLLTFLGKAFQSIQHES